ncbi:MAG: hypothetical protein E7394_07560 [Ruminococcaceae bacterium]|nr:hypothetical protein [Oscillospiraceae bacterium]
MNILKYKKTLVLVVILIIFIIRHIININTSFYLPDYNYMSLKNDISLMGKEIDYKKIIKYTGLSPFAAKEMINNGDVEKLLKINKTYFQTPDFEKTYIAFPITAQEQNTVSIMPMASLKKGDILITYNTHTFEWRHGHAAIVVDDSGEVILEHMAIGQTSVLSSSSKWSKYPGFIILRHPDEETARRAAEYAYDNLVDIPYNIFAGLTDKDMSDDVSVASSHCSHIVWQAYKAVGCDLDSNRGSVVTPEDIALSDELRVVQIYGINPEKYKDRFLY